MFIINIRILQYKYIINYVIIRFKKKLHWHTTVNGSTLELSVLKITIFAKALSFCKDLLTKLSCCSTKLSHSLLSAAYDIHAKTKLYLFFFCFALCVCFHAHCLHKVFSAFFHVPH